MGMSPSARRCPPGVFPPRSILARETYARMETIATMQGSVPLPEMFRALGVVNERWLRLHEKGLGWRRSTRRRRRAQREEASRASVFWAAELTRLNRAEYPPQVFEPYVLMENGRVYPTAG